MTISNSYDTLFHMPERHLWEPEHPYYCEQGNYLADSSIEAHYQFPSWEEFHEFATTSEFEYEDLNLVFRWDWVKPALEDYEEGEELPSDKLMLYVVQQRRAFNLSYEVDVTEKDESAITEWLIERAKKMTSIWQPVLETALSELEE